VIDKPWANSRSQWIGQVYELEICGFEFANGGGKAVKLVRGRWIARMLERRTRESQAIIQVIELGYEIKSRVSGIEIFWQGDLGRSGVKGQIT